MQKQKKQLIIFLIFLFVVVILFVGMKIYNKNHTEETQEPSYPVTADDISKVEEFSFTNDNGSFSFIKENDAWWENSDNSIDIDTLSFESMITAALTLNSDNRIENVEDMSQYGLDAPAITVTYKTDQGSTVIEIGDYNATISLYYMRLAGDNTVYTIDSEIRNNFTKDIEDLKVLKTET